MTPNEKKSISIQRYTDINLGNRDFLRRRTLLDFRHVKTQDPVLHASFHILLINRVWERERATEFSGSAL
jgi:hypothetical protein